MASPTLLFNINCGVFISKLVVNLRASPFGSRRPTIPTASAVTIARIASPISTDRSYQPLFLHALKRHFDGPTGTNRLIKQGDIISTEVDTDDRRYLSAWSNDNQSTDLDVTQKSVNLHVVMNDL